MSIKARLRILYVSVPFVVLLIAALCIRIFVLGIEYSTLGNYIWNVFLLFTDIYLLHSILQSIISYKRYQKYMKILDSLKNISNDLCKTTNESKEN